MIVRLVESDLSQKSPLKTCHSRMLLAGIHEESTGFLPARTAISPTSMVAIEQGFPSEQHMIHDGLTLKILPVGH